MSNTELLICCGSALITLLFAGNIYFIKRLIDGIAKTDTTAQAAIVLAQNQQATLAEIKTDTAKVLGEIKGEIKELRRLEIDVAVLKHSIRTPVGARNLSDKIANAS